jgi:hypothetical protein
MKARIEFKKNGYGFGMDWTLIIEDGDKRKGFFLGQDAKVCSRMLGMSPREVIFEIADRAGKDMDWAAHIEEEEQSEILAWIILDCFTHGEKDVSDMMELDSWVLSV